MRDSKLTYELTEVTRKADLEEDSQLITPENDQHSAIKPRNLKYGEGEESKEHICKYDHYSDSEDEEDRERR